MLTLLQPSRVGDLYLREARAETSAGVPLQRGLTLAVNLLLPVVIFLVTILSIKFVRLSNLVLMLWPTPAFILAAVLRFRGAWWTNASMLAGAALGATCANLAIGNGLLYSTTIAVGNVCEAGFALVLLNACRIDASNLCNFRMLLVFVAIAGFVAPMAGATISAMASGSMRAVPWRTVWVNWYPAHALGMIAVVPFLISITSDEWRRLDITHRLGEAAALLALLVLVGFFASYFRFVAFIIVPMILFVTVRFGIIGATVATVITVAFVSYFVIFNIGDVVITGVAQPQRVLAAQVFLAFTALWSLPIASLLTERDKLLHDLSLSNARLAVESERKSDLVVGLRRHLSVAEERERLRLSHELHDQAGQSLAATILELGAIDSMLDGAARSRLQAARKRMEELGKTLHRIAWEMRPPSIDELGLRKALASYVADWNEQSGIEADFHCDEPGLDDVPSEIGTAIYRLLQEGLTNIVKHAGRPTNVSVIFRRVNATLQLIIEDDGCGFDVAATLAKGRAHRGLGIDGMRERLSLIGGTLEIESEPGAGATLFARIALDGRQSTAA